MDPPDEILDEVLVTGEQPGPALWQVKSGTNVLWILAEVQFVEKGLKWRSKQVEGVLAGTREVLAVYGSGETPESARPKDTLTPRERAALLEKTHILPPEQTLRSISPSDLYARLEAARAHFPGGKSDADQDMQRFRPLWARNRLLNRAIRALNLRVSPVTSKVVGMAERKRVKVTIVEPLYWTGATPSWTIEAAMDICPLDELLHDLDGGGARWKSRVNAWAVGDVSRLTQLVRPPPSRIPQCEGRSESSRYDGANGIRIKEAWLAAMDRSLASSSSTLAVVDAPLLLSPGGLIDVLRSRGYEVVEPLQQ